MSLKTRIGDLLASELLRPYITRWLCFGLLRRPRPAYLVDCWRYPSSEFPPAAGGPLPVSRGTNEPDVLFLPMTDWHARTQRTQHLALALAAAGHRCFYLNPQLGFQFPRLYLREPKHRVSVLAPLILELHARLPREPVIHNRLPTPGETRILTEALRELIRLTGTVKLVQVVSLPFWLDAALRIRDAVGSPIIYDCHDHLAGFSRLGRELVEREAELFRRCDLAVFSSQALMDTKTAELPELLAKSRLIRNAAGSRGPLQPGVPWQADRGSRPAKVIGYVGALDHWFDINAVTEAARRRPEWEFILIGRVEWPAVWDLMRLPNVKLLGEIPHSELGARIAGFDVGLIPFLVNELTLAANPIKLYEYFRQGLPVVSSDLPEVRMFGDLVYISNSPSDFAAKVEIAATEQDEPARQRRMAIASRETWTNRALEFGSVFQELRDRSPGGAACHGR